jgi:hypothetical protein
LQLAIEGEGVWKYIQSEMVLNGRGDVYNKKGVKTCVHSALFGGELGVMSEAILESNRKDLGLSRFQFVQSPYYDDCDRQARQIASEMQTSAVITDVRAVSSWFRKAYDNEYLEGPTGHRYLVTESTFPSAFAHFLQSYEFALLAQATCETVNTFPRSEVIGHYYDGNVVIVPVGEEIAFIDCMNDCLNDLGNQLDLHYAQRIGVKCMYPNLYDEIAQ